MSPPKMKAPLIPRPIFLSPLLTVIVIFLGSFFCHKPLLTISPPPPTNL